MPGFLQVYPIDPLSAVVLLLLTHTCSHTCVSSVSLPTLPSPILLNPPTSRLLLLSTLSRAIHPTLPSSHLALVETVLFHLHLGLGQPAVPRASRRVLFLPFVGSFPSAAIWRSFHGSSPSVGHPNTALLRTISKFFAGRTFLEPFRQRQPPPRRQTTSATAPAHLLF